MRHNFSDECHLVPLGYYNWKWSQARKNYATYEQELLSGILLLGSQSRILAHLQVVWLCDQEAVSQFLRANPWWVFLSQFRLNIHHIPGAKNEFCDLLSRESFNEQFQTQIELLAKEAFQRMDLQLDLRFEVLEALGEFSKEDYLPDFQDLWDKLYPGKITLVDQKMHFRDEKRIFVEKKILLPAKKLDNAIEWCHKVNGHPGAQRTLWFILKHFHLEVPTKRLLEEIQRVIAPCRVCAEAKPNTQADRGLVGALPIPSMINEILYVDFT